MTNRIIHSHTRGALDIDILAGLQAGQDAVPEPSQDLLDRAHIGWERFIGSIEMGSGD
ncbi:hypothetical protein ACWF95_35400 [Streptomyces vinaceus]|uniref:hypothetical protein n=1 Tax=Streptomyces vinaceus TaxID=1960 RepID=UPI0035D9988D